MTVTYTALVANSSFGCFLKLLIRWRGSIYKLVWREFLLFLSAYYSLSFLYRFVLGKESRRIFEKVAEYCDTHSNLIPVAFVLGFYVSIVVTRWWQQFLSVPWPDRMSLFVMAHIHGHDERGRLMRRTIVRYICLSFVITLSSISSAVKKRFPTFEHMTEAGFMMPNEQKIAESLQTHHNKYFIPLVWATSLVTRARKEGRIKDDFGVKTLIDEINEYRGHLGGLFNFDWISIPLVYTQVVTLSVYTFFLSCLMGRQFLDPKTSSKSIDFYVPVFTFLQFFFYMGWLKVAETLVNPFGEDDDDFEMNWVIDRNLQVCYLIVDEMHQEHPQLIKDQYWDEVNFELPYTAAAEQFRRTEDFLGSAMNVQLEPHEAEFLPMPSILEDNDDVSLDLEAGVTSNPTNIPQRKSSNNSDPRSRLLNESFKSSTGASPSSPRVRKPVWHLLRRTLSRQSGLKVSKSQGTKNGSVLSLNTEAGSDIGSVTNAISNDEIFAMSDIDNEDELDNLKIPDKPLSPDAMFQEILSKARNEPSSVSAGMTRRKPDMASRESSTKTTPEVESKQASPDVQSNASLDKPQRPTLLLRSCDKLCPIEESHTSDAPYRVQRTLSKPVKYKASPVEKEGFFKKIASAVRGKKGSEKVHRGRSSPTVGPGKLRPSFKTPEINEREMISQSSYSPGEPRPLKATESRLSLCVPFEEPTFSSHVDPYGRQMSTRSTQASMSPSPATEHRGEKVPLQDTAVSQTRSLSEGQISLHVLNKEEQNNES